MTTNASIDLIALLGKLDKGYSPQTGFESCSTTTRHISQREVKLVQSSREAPFLVTAALHSACFLTRQFSLDREKVAVQVRRKILFFGHGTATTHANGTRLIHLSAKPIDVALGLR